MKIRVYDRQGGLLHERDEDWQPYSEPINVYDDTQEYPWRRVGTRTGERLMIWPPGEAGSIDHVTLDGKPHSQLRNLNICHSFGDTFALTRNDKEVKDGTRRRHAKARAQPSQSPRRLDADAVLRRSTGAAGPGVGCD